MFDYASPAVIGRIEVPNLRSSDKGIFLEIPDRREDFWLFMGPMVGWMKFSLVTNRLHASPYQDTFEAVATLPPGSPEPCPVVSIRHVLWRRREAISAELNIRAYLEGLDQNERENP
jgi:hypothetical protein